ncbi:hypothetical protein PTSG_10920 [Salpingoeca rosetta]|uniref:Uncharacterized protein n=1 Tax=Salpingoeca rosetta (strain ATCC 50818 / BSB-021) TaxID=946362 RepID=F2URE1_SALR5|nr:uncharacterized protein PTSG_10920 [Salpingoeca rosetta]EGD80244.1 hypothetical protein PTSG_10920 [Salpingoeca rosetta]|eukprot:XP_004988306.1 hypothetical protein PTSG_10920 [Salpingoeca rosetta]
MTTTMTMTTMRTRTRFPLILVLLLCCLLFPLFVAVQAEVTLNEDEHGAFHINTNDPVRQAVHFNGVDVLALLRSQQSTIAGHGAAITEQNALLDRLEADAAAQTAKVKQLRAATCRAFPPSVSASVLSGLGANSNVWFEGVMANNGLIYGIPSDGPAVYIIDPETRAVNLELLSPFPASPINQETFKWSGGVLARNGRIYAIPLRATAVLVIDPETHTLDLTSMAGFTPNQQGLWFDGVEANNGLIYGIPYSSSAVLIVDPDNHIADNTTIVGLGDAAFKWSGGVLAGNGKIYGVPAAATSVLIIDPASNTVDTTTLYTGMAEITAKWSKGVLAGNGKIYSMPYNAPSVLVIDPVANTVDTTSMANVSPHGTAWLSNVLADNGYIYAAPFNISAIAIIDPFTDTIDLTLKPLPSTGFRWTSVVRAPNGKLYAPPYSRKYPYLLIIDPGC